MSRSPLGGASQIMLREKHMNCWRIAWWSLLVVWVACAILDVNHIHAGLVTSYGADLTLPAWLYLTTRSLDNPQQTSWLKRIFGGTPELAGGIVFLASALTEVSQYYWPRGLFRGVFDCFDIVAYGTGILACYIFDKRYGRKPADVSG
jgi:hypothetical protein